MTDTIPVGADSDTLTRLMDAFEGEIPGGDLVEYARSLGVEPPDERSGWDIVHEYSPDFDDLGLRWYHADDDPATRLED